MNMFTPQHKASNKKQRKNYDNIFGERDDIGRNLKDKLYNENINRNCKCYVPSYGIGHACRKEPSKIEPITDCRDCTWVSSWEV